MSTDKLPQNDDDRLNDTLEKELFKPWEKKLKEKFDKELKEKGCKEFKFSKDGALQGYSDQKFKILFIGKEVHSGCTSIVEHVNDVISKWEGVDTCWEHAIWIAYGLLHGVECWDKIPQVVKLKKEDGAEDVASFAVIEVSKYANPDDSTAPSLCFTKIAFESLELTRKEIDILNPNLIISWNLAREPGVDFLKRLTDPSLKGPFPDDPKSTESNPVSIWTYKGKREIPLLNTYHFSAWYKSPQKDIYEPVMRAVKELIEQRKDKDKAWSELSKIWSQS